MTYRAAFGLGFFLVLQLAGMVACSDQKVVERPTSIGDSVAVDSTAGQPVPAPRPMMAVAAVNAPVPQSRVDTSVVTLFDTAKAGDTTRYHRRRTTTITTTTLAVTVSDSTWYRYPLSSVTRGIPFGVWNLPPDSMGTRYNAAVLGGQAPWRALAAVKAKGGHVVLNLADAYTVDASGLSVAATRTFLTTWPDSATFNPYVRDGTVLAISVSDDVTDKVQWGPCAPCVQRIDSLGLLLKQRYGSGTPTAVRTTPTAWSMGPLGAWKPANITYLWGQYVNRLGACTGCGGVTGYRDRELAKAKALGVGMIFGLNTSDGGDGSSGLTGTKPNLRKMSGAEIIRYAAVLLPCTPIFTVWDYKHLHPSQLAALAQVRTMADTLSVTRCSH